MKKPPRSLSVIGGLAAVFLSIAFSRLRGGILDGYTGLVLLLALSLSIMTIVESVFHWLGTKSTTRNNVRTLAVTVFVLVTATETLLRQGLSVYTTHSERNLDSRYRSRYQVMEASWYHVRGPNRVAEDIEPEFVFRRQINSLGLAEREIPEEKSPDELRIFALGDSFTEGVGTTADSTWVRVMERRLRELLPSRDIAVFNAGTAGSDPFFEYVLLRDKLVPLSPDLVIVAINQSDVLDVSVRGGMARFLPDGSTRYVTPAPKWEWLYALSFITRHVIHDVLDYDWRFVRRSAADQFDRNAAAQLQTAVDSLDQLARDRGFELAIVYHPGMWEAVGGKMVPAMEVFMRGLAARPNLETINMLEYFTANDVITTDNALDFFWPIDTHNNGAGYEALGIGIAEELVNTGLLDARESSP